MICVQWNLIITVTLGLCEHYTRVDIDCIHAIIVMLFQFRIVNELDGDLVELLVLIVDLFASFLLTICSWASPQPCSYQSFLA